MRGESACESTGLSSARMLDRACAAGLRLLSPADRNRRWLFCGGVLIFTVGLGLFLASADRRVMWLARNTACFCLGASAISLVLGSLLAFLLVRTDLPCRRWALGAGAALLFLPLYVQAAGWDAGFGKLGWYALVRESWGMPGLSRWVVAIWIQGLAGVAWVTLIVGAALRTSEPELEELALLDGTVPQVLWHVTLRRAMPAVLASAVWVIAMAASDMTVTDLYQIRTLAEELYTDFAMGDDVQAVVAGPSLVAFTAALAGLVMVGLSAAMVPAWRVGQRPCVRFTLGRWRIPATALTGAALLLVVGVPVGNLVYQAGTVVEHVGADRVRGWSAGRFMELLLPAPATYRVSALWQFRREFTWTVVIGACAATMSVAMAVPLAWRARRGGASAFVLAGLTSLGLAAMGPLVGLSLIWLFSLSDHPWLVWSYDRTILAPILAACWRSLPLSLLICWVSLGSVSRSLVDCATLDGAGRLTRLWHAGVMQRGSSLGVAWLVALAVALGELSATILVAPPGVRTIAIRLFGLLHAGVENQAAAVCLMILALYGVVTGLLVIAIRFAVRAAGSARLPFVRA